MLQTESIVVCPECLYDYRIHSTSISRDPAKAERRELGYHRSMEKIIRSLAVMPELQSWFFTKYAPEIVNGVIHSIKHRFPLLRTYLLGRMTQNSRVILESRMISASVKIKCILLRLLSLAHLIT